jgi:hypothetical protein
MTSPDAGRPDAHRAGPVFWITAAGGWAVIGYGLWGVFHHHIDTRPTNLAKFVVEGALLHDLAFAPIVLILGVLLVRALGGRARAFVQAALIVSGCVALFSYPLVRGYGHANHNPTSLPHNYTANLALVLALVWAAATTSFLVCIHRTNSDL